MDTREYIKVVQVVSKVEVWTTPLHSIFIVSPDHHHANKKFGKCFKLGKEHKGKDLKAQDPLCWTLLAGPDVYLEYEGKIIDDDQLLSEVGSPCPCADGFQSADIHSSWT